MESLDTTTPCLLDDLLNFESDFGEEDDDDDKPKDPSSSSSLPVGSNPNSRDPDDHSRSLFPELAEEELEWISNKDAFPSVEEMLAVGPGNILKHRSPVSVLENSNSSSSSSNSSTIMSCCGNLQVPVRARSKRRRKRRRVLADDVPNQQWWWWSQQGNNKHTKLQSSTPTPTAPTSSSSMGRKCQHCQAEKTPQWRAGPLGPKTLCNACGVRYKSGRLVPEYRPASSPTFSGNLHSNSHRKIVEMRRLKQREFG